MAHWLGGRISATRTERARELLTRLAPRLIKICAQTQSPDDAFKAFGSFFDRVNGGVSLLAMFLQEPDWLTQTIELMLVSPRLSDTLAGRPAILEAMIAPNFMQVDIKTLGREYSSALNPEYDFEEAMNFVRRRLREDQFRISASVLSSYMPLAECPAALSKLADETLDVMLSIAAREVERRAGPITGDYAVLALGKAGGRELSLASDLDVMVIYDAPVQTQNLYTKLTQRLISAVSSVTAEGQLYELDMALRPSGRSGPVAVSLDAFERYYSKDAWTWEFMALTRARVMASSSQAFTVRLNEIITKVTNSPRPDLNMPSDIADMLLRLRCEKPPRGPWDVKLMEGGARDIEFIAQSLFLSLRADYAGHCLTATETMLLRAVKLKQISQKDYEVLLGAHEHFSQLTQYFALTHGSLSGQINAHVGEAASKYFGLKNADQLAKQTSRHADLVRARVEKFIPI